jgi:uncharacterized membrane protein
MSNRIKIIDDIRALAIILMIIFHFSYDLKLFGLNQIDFHDGFWFWLPRLIVFLFLYCVGYSLCLSYAGRNMNWAKFKKRSSKLIISALLVSLVTYFLFPNNWIYFGTLHCIALSSLLGILIVNKPKTAALITLIIPLSQYILGISYKDLSQIIPVKSMDFIPIYPWFFVVTLGISQYHYLPWKINYPDYPLRSYFNLLSQHSLKIYLAHQPILFGLIWLYYNFVR